MDRLLIRKDTYFDSVFLMAVSARLEQRTELDAAQVALATPANRALLAEQGFDPAQLDGLGASDLVIALRGREAAALEQAAALAGELLAAGASRDAESAEERPVGLEGALSRLPGANLALISVPGAYAAHEARRALERGLHVMIFSDNVSLDDEVALKVRAGELGRLCMGPDCGTALVQGKPLGFANRLRRGPVGLVGASGTGLQEVSCQVHALGSGVSHILGTGGRDLSREVGGRTTLQALELLAADPQTRVLVVVSKPPAEEVARRVVQRLEALGKPAVVCFLGQRGLEAGGKVRVAGSLGEAARLAVALANPGSPLGDEEALLAALEPELVALAAGLGPRQRLLHGLFCGGTLAGEALLTLRGQGLVVGSNLDPGHALPDPEGHTVVDLGDDRFTRGKPHPMIDPSPRDEQILGLGSDPRTAVLLLDLVLGSGSHADPAAGAAAALERARAANPGLVVLCSVTGTDLDPQGLAAQTARLQAAGARVSSSNVLCALCAARVIRTAGDAASGSTKEEVGR